MSKLPELSQEHLDTITMIKGEADAMLQAGGHGIVTDNARRFSLFADAFLALAQTVISQQAAAKAKKVEARTIAPAVKK